MRGKNKTRVIRVSHIETVGEFAEYEGEEVYISQEFQGSFQITERDDDSGIIGVLAIYPDTFVAQVVYK